MSSSPATVPCVLVFAGLDSTGGAGLQAEIEANASMGCHAAPVATALTVQDTHDVQASYPVEPATLIEAARAVLEDLPVAACKIGLVGSVALVEAIDGILADYPALPVVLDPVLASGAGSALAGDDVQSALTTLLFPRTTVLTPNSREARTLAPEADSLGAAGQALLARGCDLVLITGTHEPTDRVVNLLYGNLRQLEAYTWDRLPGEYHGSGCTLASAIAGLLAQGHEPLTAIRQAQEYTWESLKHAYRTGRGQLIPNRLFWARSSRASRT
jgi:hydroxymethylpyrimidine/phosphomethylpyrimidine kinase